MTDFSTATERDAINGFLDQQRECLIRKITGVSEADARRAPTASSLSLLGIIKHSALWERRWFQVIMAGRHIPGEWPDRESEHGNDEDFMLSDEDTVDHWVAVYRAEAATSREIAADLDLDAPIARQDLIEQNLRFVLLHMIEETARHAGHADIIRETLDGSRGI